MIVAVRAGSALGCPSSWISFSERPGPSMNEPAVPRPDESGSGEAGGRGTQRCTHHRDRGAPCHWYIRCLLSSSSGGGSYHGGTGSNPSGSGHSGSGTSGATGGTGTAAGPPPVALGPDRVVGSAAVPGRWGQEHRGRSGWCGAAGGTGTGRGGSTGAGGAGHRRGRGREHRGRPRTIRSSGNGAAGLREHRRPVRVPGRPDRVPELERVPVPERGRAGAGAGPERVPVPEAGAGSGAGSGATGGT